MAHDPLLDLLTKQSATRLRELEAELLEALQRTKFERDLVLRALEAKGARTEPDTAGAIPTNSSPTTPELKAPRRRNSQRGSDKRQAIKAVMQTDPSRVWMPTEIARAIAGDDEEANRDSVRVMMRRMVEQQELERPASGKGFRLRTTHQAPVPVVPGTGEQREVGSENGSQHGAGQADRDSVLFGLAGRAPGVEPGSSS